MKNKSKFIQIIVFITLIIAFTSNHYNVDVFATCNNKHPFRNEPINKQDTGMSRAQASKLGYALCLQDYGKDFIHIIKIELRKKQAEKIPADLILIFIGGGIIYFTREKRKPNSN